MNQITKMFEESNSRMNKIMKGKYNADEITAAQREFEGQIKLVNAVVNAFAVASKNKRAMNGLDKMNIMDTTTAVDLMLGDPEVDKVKCPLNDEILTRSECLDYSGSHFDDCKECEIGIKTKNLLLNDTPYVA